MRKTLFLVGMTLLFAAMPLVAQENNALPAVAAADGIEDSDLTVKSDYYTGQFQVRSGDEVYNVSLFSGYPYFIHDHIHLSNVANEIINKNIFACDRRTGESLMPEYLVPMKIDHVVMKSIMQEVFPSCSFGGNGDLSISIWMIIDPDILKVKEVSITLIHLPDDNSMFSVPPYRIRMMEKLIKERIVADFPIPFEYLSPSRQNASYHVAKYTIRISDFDLGISSGPVRDL